MREQVTMAPSTRRGRVNGELAGVYRGKVLPNGVSYRDVNGAKQTLVDLYMYDVMPPLPGVPLMATKINRNNGVYEDPEPGDLVVVAFFGGIRDPIVIGFIPPADNLIQSLAAEAPQSHHRRNGTDLKIEKDGTRRVHVAKDDVLEVVGNGSLIVHGNVTMHIMGTADITVDGNTTVTTPVATVHASEKVTLDTPLTECSGDLHVAGGISAAGTYGSSGGDIHTPGDVIDGTRSMAADRAIYNGHNHNDPQGGTVGTPNQQQ
jgi:phage baseplate assembly protein gpV